MEIKIRIENHEGNFICDRKFNAKNVSLSELLFTSFILRGIIIDIEKRINSLYNTSTVTTGNKLDGSGE